MVPRSMDLVRLDCAALTLAGVLLLAGCSRSPRPALVPTPPGGKATVPRDASSGSPAHDAPLPEVSAPLLPESAPFFKQTGIASFYASKFEGRRTANGERYRARAMTAAHRTLPFGTRVRVKNLANGTTVEVVINDRGPHRKGRIVDLSRCAAEALGFIRTGLTRVAIEVLEGPPSAKSSLVED